ncbi:ATP-binding protein [Nonomuraea sp. SYSU D8015]|uniref:ATP-binding protein n=1 Tax=Nonomuraea sp. SYSU D8015 TaxID=2593644 RepID=UPI0016602D66|nr:helix-turn-helix domain-containing protein [Nonomuraea sp. SYSU D8015]
MKPGDGLILGSLLRRWRQRALLTQEQLATRAGLSVRTIRRMEGDVPLRPRTASVRLLAEALGLDDAEQATLAAAARGAGPPASATPARPKRSRDAGPVPRQLPADAAEFTGRAYELALLEDDAAAEGTWVHAIDGMAGIGKTALAVHAAHRVAARFPDGQLFVDLHGHTQGAAPVAPDDVLARMLGALGVSGNRIPRDLDERAALYRTLLAGRRVLIVLDNAADESQVRPLLPGSPGCRVLITSRRRLTALDAAATMSLDVLPVDHAVALLSRTAGEDRVAGTPASVLAETVRQCGLLPLAIRIAAARLRSHPTWSVAHLLGRLGEHDRRLAELEAGRRSVTAALDLSYRELPDELKRTYRLLSLHVGADFATDAAAALLDTTASLAGRLLERLLEVHLLQESAPGRYHFHDLVREHAAGLAAGEADGRAAPVRLLDHYRRTATAAMGELYPYEFGGSRERTAGGGRAAAWLEAELDNLLAAARYAADHALVLPALRLPAALHFHLRMQGRYSDAEALHTRALGVARAAGCRTGEMNALMGRSDMRRLQGRYEPAVDDATHALAIARALRERVAESRALVGLGMVHAMQGRFDQADDHLERALEIACAVAHRRAELDALIGLSMVERLRGRYRRSADRSCGALALARSLGHRTGELRSLSGLAQVHLVLGRTEQAADHFSQALAIARAMDYRVGELPPLNGLADVQRLEGRHDQAIAGYHEVLELAREIGNRNWQYEALQGMGRLHHATGHPHRALASHREALDLAVLLDQPVDQARAHDGLAYAHHALGHAEQARRHWRQALDILIDLGLDTTEEEQTSVTVIQARLELGAAVGNRG